MPLASASTAGAPRPSSLTARGPWREALLVLAVLAAYANALRTPFQFDDGPSILDNPTIRRLWPLTVPLSPPAGWGHTVEGRPVLNLSLAVNHAISGLQPWSYHAMNIAIHAGAALALFGVLRRALRSPGLRDRTGAQADTLALLGAAIWALHPLQTESVTYVIQRAESLAGLFFLVTLYAFARAAESSSPRAWGVAAVAACALGMATKEIMVAAPLLVLLYDRTFVAGSFAAAWRQRGGWHLALAATWAVLAWLVAGAGNRGGTFVLSSGAAWWDYWLTQGAALTHYLRLAVWPQPLVFDYGPFQATTLAAAAPPAGFVLALLGATVVALWRWPAAGFAGAWFFLILAPTSLVPGVQQMIVEHRVYLPLAAVAGALAWGAAALPARWLPATTLALALGLGGLTVARNHDYRSAIALWADTLAKRPDSARAMGNLGSALYAAGRYDEALARLREARRRDATNVDVTYNLGLALVKLNQREDALPLFAEAAHRKPHFADAHFKLGQTLIELGRPQAAVAPLREAVRWRPDSAEVHGNLGVALAETGQLDEAIQHYEAALRARPSYAEAASNLGAARLRRGETAPALEQLKRAVELDPALASARFNLGQALAATGRREEAVREYAEAVRLDPQHAEARLNLGIARAQAGDLASALAELEAAVRLRPTLAAAHANLGIVKAEAGRPADALACYEAALRLRPDYAEAHYNLGNALLMLRRRAEARAHFARALELEPRLDAAREMMARLDAAGAKDSPP